MPKQFIFNMKSMTAAIRDKHGENMRTCFLIAGHRLQLFFPATIDLLASLPSFAGFIDQEPELEQATVNVEIRLEPAPAIVEERKLLSDVSIEWGDRFRFEETEHCYITSVESLRSEGGLVMHSEKDFQQSIIYADPATLKGGTVLTWLLMVAYGQSVLAFQTVLIHASVIENKEQGYAFLGKSGTGKSTHSRLWLAHIPGSRLLNDDNPAVRVLPDGQIWIYGTPWSGKTPCYINRGVPLRGIVRLQQAPANQFSLHAGKLALITLLPSCTSIRWNRPLFDQMVNTIGTIIAQVKVGQLACLPDQQAAALCYKEITKR